MAQLGELQKHADEFKQLDAELIFVFREEEEGVEGLKKILAKHPNKFTLALDKDKESSRAYSTKRMTFDNFVIDKEGNVAGIIDGSLRVRATSEQLREILQGLQ